MLCIHLVNCTDSTRNQGTDKQREDYFTSGEVYFHKKVSTPFCSHMYMYMYSTCCSMLPANLLFNFTDEEIMTYPAKVGGKQESLPHSPTA